jgi:hypothetical protein
LGKKEGIFESNYNRYLLIWSIPLSENYNQAYEILKIIEKSFETNPVEESLRLDNLSMAYINFAEFLVN